MFAEYSQFFTSGLLSPPSSSPTSLRSSQDSFVLGPRRGSLPTDSISSTADDASMFYFTLQPGRDKDQFRSFLSLDLAESQSLRSYSVRRGPSEPPFAVDFQIPDSPCLPMGLRKSSSGSLRALPSPKPAPASPLPSVPGFPNVPRSPTIEVVVSRTPTPLVIHAVPQRKASMASQATRASATTSTVSTRYRRTRRNKALACLEGRRPVVPTGNFMRMDEDSEEEDEPVSAPAMRPTSMEEMLDLSLSDDQLIMLIARLDDGDIHSAPASSTPSSKLSSRESSKRSSAQPRRRRKTSVALKSFMDFHNDDDSSRFSWRSFIEIAT
ncbi:hypothetical protein DFH07DRAFT_362442 [Mycena maculata]|uniref:Uncharacterized protein n=1 Tax=Mycena maculata TaxID=230809 RepID=A0AAD7JI81_9AGAR|nr:hypothetical protein DFH07DRAFT_362442 [Mycena maculata]